MVEAKVSLVAALLPVAQLWYALPLIVAISLVYGATRHELRGPILHHAWHTGLWMTGFLGLLLAVLWLVSLWV
jgi:hypothetical protein